MGERGVACMTTPAETAQWNMDAALHNASPRPVALFPVDTLHSTNKYLHRPAVAPGSNMYLPALDCSTFLVGVDMTCIPMHYTGLAR